MSATAGARTGAASADRAAPVRRVLVLGGGIGGLTLACALRRHDIDVDVAEIKLNDDRLGVGMLQPANALRALRSVGLLQSCLEVGFASDERRYFDAAGRQLVAYSSERPAGSDLPAVNCLPRPALHQVLKDAVGAAGARLRLGCTAVRLNDTGEAVSVVMNDDSQEEYDLVVGADGIRSWVRQEVVAPGVMPAFSGYGCWRVTLPRPAEVTYHGIYQGINGTKAGLVPLTEATMYLYLVTNEPGNPRLAEERLHELLRDRLQGYEGRIGAIRDGLGPASDVVYTPLEELVLEAPWHRGRVILIGDAAHASLPHMAQGAAMAVEDAIVLAELAARSLTMRDRFDQFMTRRFDRCRYIQQTSRQTADRQQSGSPAEVLSHQEYLSKAFPRLWRDSEQRLAEPI